MSSHGAYFLLQEKHVLDLYICYPGAYSSWVPEPASHRNAWRFSVPAQSVSCNFFRVIRQNKLHVEVLLKYSFGELANCEGEGIQTVSKHNTALKGVQSLCLCRNAHERGEAAVLQLCVYFPLIWELRSHTSLWSYFIVECFCHRTSCKIVSGQCIQLLHRGWSLELQPLMGRKVKYIPCLEVEGSNSLYRAKHQFEAEIPWRSLCYPLLFQSCPIWKWKSCWK